MLSEDEYRIILRIECATDHQTILAVLTSSRRGAPFRSAEFRQRLAAALHWARERVSSQDQELILQSRVAIQISRGLLKAIPPSQRLAGR